MQALTGITYITMLTWVRLPVSVYSWMAAITASTMARYKVTKYLHTCRGTVGGRVISLLIVTKYLHTCRGIVGGRVISLLKGLARARYKVTKYLHTGRGIVGGRVISLLKGLARARYNVTKYLHTGRGGVYFSAQRASQGPFHGIP